MKLRHKHSVCESRSSKTPGRLSQIGSSSLLDSAVVTFTLAMVPANENVLLPYAARVQDICDIPWERWAARKGVLDGIDRHVEALARTRRLMKNIHFGGTLRARRSRNELVVAGTLFESRIGCRFEYFST